MSLSLSCRRRTAANWIITRQSLSHSAHPACGSLACTTMHCIRHYVSHVYDVHTFSYCLWTESKIFSIRLSVRTFRLLIYRSAVGPNHFCSRSPIHFIAVPPFARLIPSVCDHSSRIRFLHFFSKSKNATFNVFLKCHVKNVKKNVESVVQVFTFVHFEIANGHFRCK